MIFKGLQKYNFFELKNNNLKFSENYRVTNLVW